MERVNSKKNQNNNDTGELIDTLNKIIYDVNLLMEKMRDMEKFKKYADKEIFEVRADTVDLKADDKEIKKTIAVLGKEVNNLEHEARKLNERVDRLYEKTKVL